MAHFAEILLPQKVGPEKTTLTYSIPPDVILSRGNLVEIPLRNKKVKGVVWDIHTNAPPYATKPIHHVINNAPHLSAWQLELLVWLADYYCCELWKALKLFLPTSLLKKKQLRLQSLSEENPYTLKFHHQLEEDQQKALKLIQNNRTGTTLLHGITGSGKTEIYLHTAEYHLKQNKQVLMLIPEISLTPQISRRFQDHFNEKVVIIHSQLTPKQKENAWLSIYRGEARIVIGSRSALFAPFKELGIIIMDEEHDSSYKQDQTPRYHALTVAQKITNLLHIPLLLGSATPSLETYYKAQQGEIQLLELRNRPNKTNGKLPTVTIIDLREEIKKKNFSMISELLQEKITEKLKKKEQVLLFLNRRGAASAVLCRSCGFVVNCNACELPMTYHQKLFIEGGIHEVEKLMCHHCGRIENIPNVCPQCESSYIRYLGSGTQKIETELTHLFPQARIVRADRDTIQRRDDFENIYNKVTHGEVDIIVGTQMIATGLHLPKVNLVGVILADLGLTFPHFRSAERTFQLINQVAGRAGREGQEGEVIVQSYLPHHYAITYTAEHNYKGFYEHEIELRKRYNYPPFNKLIKLTITDKQPQRCKEKTIQLHKLLDEKLLAEGIKNTDTIIRFYPALIPKLKYQYRWHILLEGPQALDVLKATLQSNKENFNNIAIDVDPLSTV